MSFVKSAMSVLSVGALVVNAQMYVWEPETGCGGANCKLVVDSECISLTTENENSAKFDWTKCNKGCMEQSDCVGFNFNPSKKGKVGGCYFLQGTCSSSVANIDGIQGVIKGAFTSGPTSPTTSAPSSTTTAPTVYSCDGQEIYVEKVGKTKVYKCGVDGVCAVVTGGSKMSKDWTCADATSSPSPAPTAPTVYSCDGQEIYVEKVGKAKVYKCGVDGVCAVASVKNGKKTTQTCVTATSSPSPAPTAPTVYSCSDYEPYQVKEGKAKVYICGDTDVCDVQITKNGKKSTYTCVAKTEAPVAAPTAPTTWSCAVDMEFIKKGKKFRNVCATPDQCKLEKYKEDGKSKYRCVAV